MILLCFRSSSMDKFNSPPVKNDSEQMLFQKKSNLEELLDLATSSEDDDDNNKLCRRRSLSITFVHDISDDDDEIIKRKLHKRSMSFHGRKSVR